MNSCSVLLLMSCVSWGTGQGEVMPVSDVMGSSSDEPTLRSVAGFRLLRCLGEGGMSRVYLSFDVENSRTVAIKVLADHLADSPEFVTRFYREARLSRLLSHPNLVQGLAAGYDPLVKKHFIVLEYIPGATAQSVLRQMGCLPLGQAVQIGIEIASALAFLHARQYVHRDVKPDNILIAPGVGAKLADLGLAKRLNDDPQLTAANQGVGTAYYMPYEQALNASLVDGRSDVFALGATLYHLIQGELPFPGSTRAEIMKVMRQGEFPHFRNRLSGLPESIVDVLIAAMAIDPRARIQTAQELAESLAATGLAEPLTLALHVDLGSLPEHPDAPTRADLELVIPGNRTGCEPLPTDQYPCEGDIATSEWHQVQRESPPTITRISTAMIVLLGMVTAGLLWAVLGLSDNRNQHQMPETLVCDDHTSAVCTPYQ